MSSITENPLRIGSFTSSKIFKLLTLAANKKDFGAPALTYIDERNLERKLGRSLEKETYSNDMAWGTFLQQRVHNILGTEYIILVDETTPHQHIDYWCGSQDWLVPGVKISELKCYQCKKFAQYTDALLTKDIEIIKKEFPQEYWQMVSNAIINSVPNAEAITYMPYKSELPVIREMASQYDESDQWKYRFIAEKEDSWLSWLPDNGYYKNLNRFEFEVPESDKNLLTERVYKAGQLLIKQPEIILASHEKELDVVMVEKG